MKKTLFLFSLLVLVAFSFGQITMETGAQLIISSGSTVIASDGIVNNDGEIDNAGTIEIKGDLENNSSGLLAATSTGTVKFNGSAAQEITGDADAAFYGTLEIDNSNGVSVTATATGHDQTVNGTLAFTAGLLTLNGFHLTLGATDATGAGSGQYVQTNSTGTLKRNVPADGSTNVPYPVGNSVYNPVILQNTISATTDDYSVRVDDADPSGGGTAHFVNRSWVIAESVALGSELTVTPQWNSGDEDASFDGTNSSVGLTTDGGTSYSWGPTTAATGTDPYTVSASDFTEGGTFTVADYFYSGKSLDLKLMLAGAYNGTDMDQDLYTASLIPLKNPYGLADSVLTVPAGAVDWVKIELRDKTDHSSVLHSYARLVDTSGQVIEGDESNFKITGATLDNYYIAVLHRNHFGVVSTAAVDLDVASPSYDFSTALAQAWDDVLVTTNDAMKDVGGVFCLWEGNAKSDAIIRYDGTDNDRLEILNSLPNAGATVNGYATTDVNMDGITRYDGTDNDRLVILNILPNAGSTYTQHLP